MVKLFVDDPLAGGTGVSPVVPGVALGTLRTVSAKTDYLAVNKGNGNGKGLQQRHGATQSLLGWIHLCLPDVRRAQLGQAQEFENW